MKGLAQEHMTHPRLVDSQTNSLSQSHIPLYPFLNVSKNFHSLALLKRIAAKGLVKCPDPVT